MYLSCVVVVAREKSKCADAAQCIAHTHTPNIVIHTFVLLQTCLPCGFLLSVCVCVCVCIWQGMIGAYKGVYIDSSHVTKHTYIETEQAKSHRSIFNVICTFDFGWEQYSLSCGVFFYERFRVVENILSYKMLTRNCCFFLGCFFF